MKTGVSMHWTGGDYVPNWLDLESYHGLITLQNGKIIPMKVNDYTSNFPQHTWNRNSSLIGIAACGMGGVNTSKKWEKPITIAMIEALCLYVAEVDCLKRIGVSHNLTHAEYADIDGYGPQSGDPQTKWDFALFSPGIATPETAKKCGDILRGKIKWYIRAIRNGEIKIRDFHYESVVNGEKK